MHISFINNLKRRLKEHNLGRSKYTKAYMPWKIVYFEKQQIEMMLVRKKNIFDQLLEEKKRFIGW